MTEKILDPCPKCGDAWFYVSDGDYYSGYETYGIKVECNCKGSFSKIDWQPTRERAAERWNEIMKWERWKKKLDQSSL